MNSKWAWSPWHLQAENVKEQVSNWAYGHGYLPITEIGEIIPATRLDVLLVPLSMDASIFAGLDGHWTDRLGLVGVEIKVDKQDYKRGLEEGQFTKYAAELSGLYIAGPRNVVVAKDVPHNYGVLSVGISSEKDQAVRVVCRRHPSWEQRTLTNEQMWRIIWAVNKQVNRDRRERDEEMSRWRERIKDRAGTAIWRAVSK